MQNKIIQQIRDFFSYLGKDWLANMSGALSVFFAAFGILDVWSKKDLFYVLAILALWITMYRMWKKIRDVSLERPLRYKNLKLIFNKDNLSIAIILKNEGSKIIKYKVTRYILEINSTMIPQIDANLTEQSIESNEVLEYRFGAIPRVKMNILPLIIGVDFLIEYDNSPSLRLRKMGRRIRYEFTSLDHVECKNLILSQVDEP